MTKTEAQFIYIEPSNIDVIVQEWTDNLLGRDKCPQHKRERKIEKVPPLLLKGPKGKKNKDFYEPTVVSLGPYHHKRTPFLAWTENYKLITLQEYVSGSGKPANVFHDAVHGVACEARRRYIHGSTDDYDEQDFVRMMLHDACFVLFFIECVSMRKMRVMLNDEYLGALGFANIIRDIFLLENQIPFVVLRVLMELKFEDGGKEILNGFFDYLNYGEVKVQRGRNVLPSENDKQPLHLLEFYRTHFISLYCFGLGSSSSSSGRGLKLSAKTDPSDKEEFNYVKLNRSFPSVTELKAKGIFVKPRIKGSLEDIKFDSYYCYGRLELVYRIMSPNSHVIFLNMIAFEMCPHNPNDFRISTYVRVMKSLVVHRDDVQELRSKNVLVHSLGRDDEVVKMYAKIDTLAVNPLMFHELKKGIERHCQNTLKTWAAELINDYFSTPWKMMALVTAAVILILTFLQTLYAVHPFPNRSQDYIIRLLVECVRRNHT